MISVIGWIGAILLAFCAAPQTWKTIKEGHANGMSWLTLLMWFGGEILTLIYILFTSVSLPLVANYAFNLVLLAIITTYKIKPRGK